MHLNEWLATIEGVEFEYLLQKSVNPIGFNNLKKSFPKGKMICIYRNCGNTISANQQTRLNLTEGYLRRMILLIHSAFLWAKGIKVMSNFEDTDTLFIRYEQFCDDRNSFKNIFNFGVIIY